MGAVWLWPDGAFLVGGPAEVADKIIRHSKALGGISRLTFQMDVAGLSHQQLMRSYELIAKQVIPIVNSHEQIPTPPTDSRMPRVRAAR